MNEPSKLTHADGSIEHIQADCELSSCVSQAGMRIVFERYRRAMNEADETQARRDMDRLASTLHGMVMITTDYLAEGDFKLLAGMLRTTAIDRIERQFADAYVS